jgi:hypothetical protein
LETINDKDIPPNNAIINDENIMYNKKTHANKLASERNKNQFNNVSNLFFSFTFIE